MRTVAIGGSGEYTKRLVRFLERHLSSDIHIITCSDTERFLAEVPKDACCIIPESFQGELPEEYSHRILLSDRDSPGRFCRFHSPETLIPMINECLNEQKIAAELAENPLIINAFYVPAYVNDLEHILWSHMKEGSLCLGLENMGSGKGENGDMGDLSYYIHLRQDYIKEKILEFSWDHRGRYFIDSPGMYFELLELSTEDLSWFFEKLRTESFISEVNLLMGSGYVKDTEIFRLFDRIVLLADMSDRRQQLFCERFGRMLESKQILLKRGLEIMDLEGYLNESYS